MELRLLEQSEHLWVCLAQVHEWLLAFLAGLTPERSGEGRGSQLGQQQHGERCVTPASSCRCRSPASARALLGLHRSRLRCRDRAEPGPGQLVAGGTPRWALGSSPTWLSPRADPANQL